MVKFESSNELIELYQRQKNVKKLIKYLEGYSKTPPNHQPRISKNIKYLKRKLQTEDLTELHKIKCDLELKLESLTKEQEHKTYLEHIRGWYFRPLINHFDSVQKLDTLASLTEGTEALSEPLKLYLHEQFFTNDTKMNIEQLQQFFKFKTMGKGSPASNTLEHRFYDLFEFTNVNPFTNTTLGELGLPVIWYNVNSFWDKLKAGERSMLVTGLCPISTITDELGFKLSDNKVVRLKFGFHELPVEYNNIKEIVWPKKPIISDYIILKNIFEVYKECITRSNVSVIIWYPYHEYYLDLTENIFKNYLAAGELVHEQISDGLDQIKDRYLRLIEYVKSELELNGEEIENDIKILKVDESCYNEVEQYAKRVDLTFFKYIYGSWIGSKLRRTLYDQLIIKHIKPVFDGYNTLHLDCTYELWVDLLGSLATAQNKLPGNFSWISYPTVPSISLNQMRDYNAPNDDKLYFGEELYNFKDSIDRLPKKYIEHVAPLILGKNNIETQKPSEVIDKFKAKLLDMNSNL